MALCIRRLVPSLWSRNPLARGQWASISTAARVRKQRISAVDVRYQQLGAFVKSSPELHSGSKFLRLPRVLSGLWRYSRTHEPLVYVRSCYAKILSLIWEHAETSPAASVVALGTPGIGKSGFLFVALWELLQKPTSWDLIIIKYKEASRFYVFHADGNITSTRDPSEVAELVESYEDRDGKVWYLADWKIDEAHWSLPCKIIMATSPDRQNHHHFFKGDEVIRLFFPTWSREEIHTLNDRVFKQPKAEVDERFDKWGGVPRHVLAKTSIHQQQELEKAIQSVATAVQDSGRLFVADAVAPGQSGYASDLVYHITVEDEESYAVASKKLATPYIADKLAAGLNMNVLDRVLNYDLATAKFENGVYAEFFDRKFHLMLLHGCTARSATMNKKAVFEPDAESFFLKASEVRFMETEEFPQGMTPEELDRTVIKPINRNNMDWDLICGRRVLQLTVSDKRKGKGLYPYGKRLGWTKALDFLRSVYDDGSLELVFAVPLVKHTEFSVTVHEGTSADARAKVMQDYANADIKVKKMSCYLGGRDEGFITQLIGSNIS